jgi:VWFA-related protein
MNLRTVFFTVLIIAVVAPAAAIDMYHDCWLASVQHLMSDAEYRYFQSLEHGHGLFIHRFWTARAAGPGWRVPAREQWLHNLEEVSRQLGTVYSDRARAMLLAGRPGQVMVCRGCRGALRDLEVWTYSRWQLEAQTVDTRGQGLSLLFVLAGDDRRQYYRHWSPEDGITALMRGSTGGEPWTAERLIELAGGTSCCDLDQKESRALATALDQALGKHQLLERLRPPIPDPEWLTRLAAELNDAPSQSTSGIEISFPGSYQGDTLVHLRIEVPVAKVARTGPDRLLDRLVMAGNLWADARLHDAFTSVTHVSGTPDGDTVALELYRLLEAGTYLLGIWVESDHSHELLAHELRELTVPVVEDRHLPAGQDLDRLTASRVTEMISYPSVKLIPPGPTLVVGRIELTAVTTGDAVAGVDFLLDGEPASQDRRPPFTAELRLGRSPRRHTVTALARDAGGRPLARDDIVLNGGPHRFSIRLVEPVPGSGGGRAQVVVEVPESERLDRVELYLDDTLMTTLLQPPFLHPLPHPATSRSSYLRAVACLEADSRCLEDTVLLHHPPSFSEEIAVRVVELFTTVVDPQGRSVLGLGADRFQVLEDGVEQPLLSFDTMDRLPIHVALLVDLSLSMQLRREIATHCTVQFFERVLEARDRAALLLFHQDIQLLVPFTNDIDRLQHGLAGARLEYGTRLWDGLIHTGHYLGGLQGKGALVLITDGLDYHSQYSFQSSLEHTLSSGVAVYPITIDLVDPLPRAQLKRLAEESGGRYFALQQITELESIFSQLEEELRSQYLLTYQSPSSGDMGRLRTVKVEVLAAADEQVLRARTIHGYYP